MDLIDELRGDYARFPQEQSYHLYAQDVYFRDPMTSFRGVDRYREMIGFMTRWFKEPKLDCPKWPEHPHRLDPLLGHPIALETPHLHLWLERSDGESGGLN
jgi:Uncharacterized conserved protein (DUF2358)